MNALDMPVDGQGKEIMLPMRNTCSKCGHQGQAYYDLKTAAEINRAITGYWLKRRGWVLIVAFAFIGFVVGLLAGLVAR